MTTDSPRALIADDQPDVTEALRLLLKREGYQTEAVHSPRAVLDSLSARDFDLLLMDLNYARDTTSGAEGLDLLGRIRTLDSSLPVVVMTAWGSIPLAVEAMRRGARDFVEKPWDNSQLLSTLRQQIGRRSSGRAAAREERRDAVATQKALLPRTIPQIPGCDIAVEWTPMKGVGGDYLDLIPVSGGRVGIAVGDVAGKGAPAALLMSNLQAAVRTLAPDVAAPASLMARVNGLAAANLAANKFITLFYGVLEGQRLTYANAGHPAPMLVHADGESQRLDAGGALLGVFPDWPYQQAEVELRSGDRLVLFTDGMVEAEDRDGVEFGEERLLALVAANRTLDAARLRQQVMGALGVFTGGAFQDDATLVVVAMV
ncbi:MAG: SpoIIE family protein phosphatase [Acidobacteriia bacterium]|nr:SpoIIE family protein phosphatase [Terriglobia bacterium]